MRFLTSRTLALALAVAVCTAIGRAEQAKPPAQGRPALQPTPRQIAPKVPVGTASLAGRVTSIAGKALARARVVVSAHEMFECPPNTPLELVEQCSRYSRLAMTDADGRWTIDKLPSGTTYVITTSKTGFETKRFGDSQTTTDLPMLTLAEAEARTTIDFTLTPQQKISGTLSDEDGSVLAGALIEILRAVDGAGGHQLVSVGEGITDDLGKFQIYGVPAGQFYVRAFDAAYGRAGQQSGHAPGYSFYPGAASEAEATRITVTAGEPLADLSFRVKGLGTAPALPVSTLVRSAGAKPGPKAALPTNSASMSGRVTALNGNQPIARARVIISAEELFQCPAGTLEGQTDNCPRYEIVALTDAAGRWAVDNLPRGKTYLVRVGRSGYAARAFGETPPAVPPSYVDLKDGEKKINIDIQLAPNSIITGTLYDEDETPFAGGLVEALRATYDATGQRQFVAVAEAITDATGHYRLHGLAPGQYYISGFDPAYGAVGDDLGQLFYGPTFYPGTVYQDDASRVQIEPGVQRDGQDFRLHIIRPARLKGKLEASGLQLLAGAVSLGSSRNSRSATFAKSDVDIHPDGTFQFANILAERYIVRARAEIERQGRSQFGLWNQPVEGQDITDVNISLAPGALLRGRVTWDGTTRPPADQSGIRVRAPAIDGSTFGDALTGDIKLDRTFELKGVNAGFHYVRMEGLPDPWRVSKVTMLGADITDQALELDYNQDVAGIEITITDRFTTLSGSVGVAPNDLPQGYAVIAFSTNRLQWRPTSRFVRITYLDDRGRFAIRGLPPAEYYVAITRDTDISDLNDPAALERLVSGATTIRLNESDRRVLSMQAPTLRPTRIGRGGPR